MSIRHPQRLSARISFTIIFVALAVVGVGLMAGPTPAAAPRGAPVPTPVQAPVPEGSPSLGDLAFMTGSWQAEWEGSTLEEHFTRPRHGSMVGMFRWISDGATRFTEHLVVEEREDGVYLFLRHFHPGSMPWEDEVEGPMTYRLTQVEASRAVFEDAQRAFPRRVVYDRTQPDTLVARLEGHRDSGETREMQFTFRRVHMPTTATDSLTAVGQSMGYNGGLTIELPVSNLDRSIDFYQNVVGFKLQYKLDEMGWAELTSSVPHVNVGLSQVEHPKPGGQTAVFGVDDIESARKQLEGKGVKFDGDTIEIPGLVKLATFYDLDGNPFKLFQELSKQMP